MPLAPTPRTADEEAPLNQLEKGLPSDDDFDPELKQYGGPYTSKFAFLQVTFRFPIADALTVVALMYGFLPFIIPATFFIHWLMTRHFIGLYGFCVSIITSLINELCLKPFFDDPRPPESANKVKDKVTGKWKMKPGMPSGHVLNASTILTWAILEVACRGPNWRRHFIVNLQWLAFIIIVMAPVPWARWYNKDHTYRQCVVAGSMGLAVGTFAFLLRLYVFHPLEWKPWVAHPCDNLVMTNTTDCLDHHSSR